MRAAVASNAKDSSLCNSPLAISSLSGVKDSAKFSELLDKISVPTVQAFRDKNESVSYRRPTQNPQRSTKRSMQAQSASRQRLEHKQQLLQQKLSIAL